MSAAVASASAAAALSHSTSAAAPTNHHHSHSHSHNHNNNNFLFMVPPNLGRYESLKRSDWNTFRHYLRAHDPPLPLTCFGVPHVLGFLNHLAQTKAHAGACPFLGLPHAPGPCACPSRSLDAVVGRLRAAFDEHAGPHVTNPFAARAVGLYLRDAQARDRGNVYDRTETSNEDINCNGNGNGNGKAEQPQVYFGRSVTNGKRGRGVGAMFFAAAGCFRS